MSHLSPRPIHQDEADTLASLESLSISGTNQGIAKTSATGFTNVTFGSGSVAWGAIQGTLSNQNDLRTALNAKQATGNYITALTGDGTASGPDSVALTLATVNSNVGTFGSATQSTQITVNGKGLITAIANVTVTPAVGSITGLGTGVATALAVNVGSAGAFITFNGNAGTPSALVGTNISGTAASLTAGTVTTNANLTGAVTSVGNATSLGSFSSANLSGALTDETGTGVAVFGTTPTFTTSIITPKVDGSASSAGNLALESTSHATKGYITFGGGTLAPRELTTTFYETVGAWVIGSNSTTAPTAGYYFNVVGNQTAGTAATQDTFGSFGPDGVNGPALTFGYSGNSFGRGSAFFNARPDASATGLNPAIYFYTNNALTFVITSVHQLKIAGTAVRGTTEGTNHLDIFDGTAPAGTLANGISLFSASGELKVADAGGTVTLLSPHDENNLWVFDSEDTVTGEKLHIDVEKLLRFVNDHFGLDFIKGNMMRKMK